MASNQPQQRQQKILDALRANAHREHEAMEAWMEESFRLDKERRALYVQARAAGLTIAQVADALGPMHPRSQVSKEMREAVKRQSPPPRLRIVRSAS